MNRERWARIDELCNAAVSLEPGDRGSFLRKACGGDQELEREVESLLALQPAAEEFLEVPAAVLEAETVSRLPDHAILVPGTRLGHYEVTGLLGRGGMGAVYRARDTRLERRVALKVLSEASALDPERRDRLAREAHAIAALNHPHICGVYDVGSDLPVDPPGTPIAPAPGRVEATTVDYLVIEHLEGETLAKRLSAGKSGTPVRLPVEEALAIGVQIADALAAAHRQGVVHRDLKPANIMLTTTGVAQPAGHQVKLLDFGLATLKRKGTATRAGGSAPSSGESPSPARSLIGTAPYMAPEQLEGKEADARSDLFAFGCVIYEMLAGRRAFAGESAGDVTSAIRTSEPVSLTTVNPATPPALDRVVKRCLAKNPDARWQNAADLADELRWVAETAAPSGATTDRAGGAERRRPDVQVPIAVMFLVIGGTVGAALMHLARASQPDLPVQRASLTEPGLAPPAEVAISPDGRLVVFRSDAGQSSLRTRRLDEWTSKALDGTEGSSSPSFSPDGKWIGFRRGRQRAGLQLVETEDGSPRQVYEGADLGSPAAWDHEGRIVFSRTEPGSVGLWRMKSTAVAPELLAQPAIQDGAVRYLWPQVLPGGESVLFTILDGGKANIAVVSLRDGTQKIIVRAGSHGHFIATTGHLVYQLDGHLYGVRFDPRQLEFLGEAYPVVRGVGDGNPFASEYDVSENGTLAYLAAGEAGNLSWKDRNGVAKALPLKIPGPVRWLALSPDDRRALLNLQTGPAHQLYIANLVEGQYSLTRFTPGEDDWYGVFSRDNPTVLFTSAEEDRRYNIYSMPAHGSGRPRRLTNSPTRQKATSILRTPAGEVFLYNERVAGGGHDIWERRIDGNGPAREFVKTTRNELEGAFSPDGRWVAYESDESGTPQIYVRGYPVGIGTKSQVSTEGGTTPVWNPQGRELFYATPAGVFVVRIQDGLRVGDPVRLFGRPPGERSWDVGSDGRRVLVFERHRPAEIEVVTNWFEELKAKAPPFSGTRSAPPAR